MVGKGVLELLTSASNMIAFFIFTSVNLLCIINYYKKKNTLETEGNSKSFNRFLKMYPWYSILGTIISFIFLVLSPGYMKNIKERS